MSAIATLDTDSCPTVTKSLLKALPIETTTYQAKWGGNEIWSVIENFDKYNQENETCYPEIGDILIVPQDNHRVCFDIWYGKGWAFGPKGSVLGANIGKITEGLDSFAKECMKISTEGAKKIRIEKI